MAVNGYGQGYPYYNGYGQQANTQVPNMMNFQPAPQQQSVASGIIWVQGEQGAKGYPVAPGNSVLLMDTEDQVFYIKTTDNNGVPQPLKIYDYTERIIKEPQTQSSDYVSRNEFEELKKMIEELTK